jgi:hypothetical protein
MNSGSRGEKTIRDPTVQYRVSYVLDQMGELVEAHSSNLETLENGLVAKDLDSISKALVSARKLRRGIKENINTILPMVELVEDETLKSQAKGILGYLYLIGLNDELELLERAATLLQSLDPVQGKDIEKDIKTVKEIRKPLAQVSF